MEENNNKKLSYEQLEQVAQQLSSQLQQAQKQINQMGNVLTRLPYLFEIVKIGDKSFNAEFVTSCAAEIEEIMKYPEEEEKKESEETK